MSDTNSSGGLPRDGDRDSVDSQSRSPSEGKGRKRVKRGEAAKVQLCPMGHIILEPHATKRCKVCRYLKEQERSADNQGGDGGTTSKGENDAATREVAESECPEEWFRTADNSAESQPVGRILPASDFNPAIDHYRREIAPDEPTSHLPGSEGKIKVLAERARLGLSLWHPRDATWGVRRGYGIYHDEV